MTSASESNTGDSDNNVDEVLTGNFPVVLTHDVNGGYLRPDALTPDHHSGEARATKTLDEATKNANGHLWYITPGVYFERLERTTYYIESACSHEPAPSDSTTDKRRRITVTTQNATHYGVAVGQFDQVPAHYRSDENGEQGRHNQLWIVTPTCCGALTFIPVLHLELIWGTLNNDTTIGACPRPVENVGGITSGSAISRWIPSRPQRPVSSAQ